MQAIFETAFDIIYLCTVITLGIIMICKSKGRKQYLLYGIMAVVLWADAVPLIGMLMITKTCAYVWTVLIGFNSLRNADRNESEAAR